MSSMPSFMRLSDACGKKSTEIQSCIDSEA
jgi:hypothetical protein